ALHAAILRSDLRLVKALLAHGADPNLPMTKGTPMRRDTTDWNLPATLNGSTPYLLAARFLESEIMPVLVAGGGDPTRSMPDGADSLGFERPVELVHPNTVALLKRLGASE